MKVVAEHARMKRTKDSAQIAQLKGDLHELKSKLGFLQRWINVAD